MPNGLNILTNSRMQCAKQCPRKHYFKYELGVRRDSDSRPLRRGGCVHKGLEAMANGRHDHIEVAIADYQVYPQWATEQAAKADWDVECTHVASLLKGYAAYWQGERNEIAEYVAVELPWELSIQNPDNGSTSKTFRIAGKIDAIVRLKDGRLALLEHKTSSDDLSPGSSYWQRLTIDSQISLYTIAAKRLGYEIDTVLYDVLAIPSLRLKSVADRDAEGFKVVVDANGERAYLTNGKPRQAGDEAKGLTLLSRPETTEEYAQRLAEDIAAQPETYFIRREIPRLNADLEEFQQELWQFAQYLRDSRNSGRWFRNSGACVQYNSPCEYLPICGNGFSMNDIPSGYVVVEELHPELVIGE